MTTREIAIEEFATWMTTLLGATGGEYATRVLVSMLNDTSAPTRVLDEDVAVKIDGLARLQADEILTAEAFGIGLEAAKLRNAQFPRRRQEKPRLACSVPDPYRLLC